MAVKDHSLDEKLIEAARAEFLDKGFRNASLHKIAERAGLTTGAIYTRYKGKDDLFCSLVQEILVEAQKQMGPLRERYEAAQKTQDPSKILDVIRYEEAFYQTLLSRHYEACVLFFCRSDGSSLEVTLRTMMEGKTAETVEYLRSISKSDLDLDGIGLIMTEQYHFFREILEKGYSQEKACRCMEVLDRYTEAGWKALLEAIL